GSNVSSTVPQNHRHCGQVSLQQRLQDVLNDRVCPKGEEGFEAPHTARFPGRQHDTYDTHGTASARAAAWIASTTVTYPVQRQRLPEMPWRISISVGCGLLSSNALAAKIIPGVQKPHCTAPYSAKAFCTGCSCSPWASPSMVVTSRPWASSAKIRQASTVLPSSSTVQAPPSPSLQPSLVPVRCSSSRSSCNSDWRGSIATSYGVPFTVSVMRRFTCLSCICGTPCSYSICSILSADSMQRLLSTSTMSLRYSAEQRTSEIGRDSPAATRLASASNAALGCWPRRTASAWVARSGTGPTAPRLTRTSSQTPLLAWMTTHDDTRAISITVRVRRAYPQPR